MYLEHFGLTEPPFKITPVTDFFFSGANRGEILDALVYAITDGEGIVKVSGEVGSGKTMLCQMLLDRLPANIKAIYLANPSMSRDELLYAIADRLDLNLEGQRVNVILQTLQNHIEAMYERGERCVVLVDEAHAMPLATLEELRLLYNLQVGKHKLIQIVLFGQPELDEKLEQSNMRQLKDRIVHNFSILPISRQVIADYLMFRMRAAGYKGPDIFSPAAVLLIGKGSQGLMRRVNVLADKALLAAFVENTHRIETRHVQAAIQDSEMIPMRKVYARKSMVVAGGIALMAGVLAGAGWLLGQDTSRPSEVQVQKAVMQPAPTPAPAPTEPASAVTGTVSGVVAASATVAVAQSAVASAGNAPGQIEMVAAHQAPPAADPPRLPEASRSQSQSPAPGSKLLQQRLKATHVMVAAAGKESASIQLFYTDDVRPERMEGFLGRAQRLGKLSEIYVVPIKLGAKRGYRVLYGHYASSEAASTGMKALPKRYKDAFAPTLYLLNSPQDSPISD